MGARIDHSLVRESDSSSLHNTEQDKTQDQDTQNWLEIDSNFYQR